MVALDPRKSKRFYLHSIAVELHGSAALRLARDFDFFTDRPGKEEEAAPYSVTLETQDGDPSQVKLPSRAADQVFSDCVLYREKNRLYYEYGGAVLVVEREENFSYGKVTSKNPHLADEIGYLYLQSEIGRFLDKQGLHRVHALGLGLPNGEAALVMLPSGGGKSTLALELLRAGGCMLLSDDTPLVDRFGNLLPYPLRLSFRADANLPPDWRAAAQTFERRRHGAKLLVPTSALPARLLPRPTDKFRPAYLVVGERHGNLSQPKMSALPRWRGGITLFRDMVVGLGVPQVAELILTRGILSLPGLAPTGASRTAAAGALLARSRTYRLELSRDHAANARALLSAFGLGAKLS